MIPRAPNAGRLFGRDRDLAIVRESIEEGFAAVAGEAGVGKTELALHLAATSERPVIWIDLAGVWDDDDGRATIARALGIALRSRDPQEGRAAIVRAAIARGDVLFVFDGAESCIEEATAIGVRLRALVVSRSAVAAAHVLDRLDEQASRDLFADRSGGGIDRSTLARLAGHPTAIELFATKGGELEEATMAEIVAGMIERLPTDARLALAKAAVFERPFSFDAFEKATGATYETLTLLGATGLLRIVARQVTIARTVRALALRTLDQGEFRAALARHASFVSGLALEALRAFEGERPTLVPDAAELRAAHATALVDRELSSEIVCGLVLALVLTDPARASIFDLDRLDATIGAAPHATLIFRVRIARAALARALGRPDEASAGFSSLREHARVSGDRLLDARALLGLGDLALDAGNIDLALAHHGEALARCEVERALAAPHLLAHLLPALARGKRAKGELDDAATFLERAIAAERHGGGEHARTLLHLEVARVRLDRGQTVEARAIVERALPLLSADLRATARALCLLGRARADRALLEEAVHVARAAAAQRTEAEAMVALLAHEILAGDLESARNHALHAIELSATDGDQVGAARATAWLGAVLAMLDLREDAEASLVTAERCGDRTVVALADIHRGHLERARARLARVAGDLAHARSLEASADRRVASPDADELVMAQRVLGHAGAVTIVVDSTGTQRIGAALLEKRPTLRRLVDALIRRRIEMPGVSLSIDELLAAGWPGERFPRESGRKVGKDRLHTSLATLRDLGLRSTLLSDETGWLLSPKIPLDLR